MIANSLPETAAVKRNEAKLPTPKYDGPPQLKPIEGTSLSYVVNSPIPVIQVSPTSYYALENGVWFVATSAGAVDGGRRPCPRSSTRSRRAPPPLRHLRLRLPGDAGGGLRGLHARLRQRLRVRGVVVYGTGYSYTRGTAPSGTARPSPTGSPPPDLHAVDRLGHGLRLRARLRRATAGWGWGCYPWWGPYRYGGGDRGARRPGARAAGRRPPATSTTAGATRPPSPATRPATTRGRGTRWSGGAGMSYNSRTGTVAAGQRGVVSNAYTGNYAYGARGAAVNPRTGEAVSAGRVTTGNVDSGRTGSAGYVRGESGGAARVGNDVYATRDGTVYRNTGGGWQQNSGSGWGDGASRPAPRSSTRSSRSARTARRASTTTARPWPPRRGRGRGGGRRVIGVSTGGGESPPIRPPRQPVRLGYWPDRELRTHPRGRSVKRTVDADLRARPTHRSAIDPCEWPGA